MILVVILNPVKFSDHPDQHFVETQVKRFGMMKLMLLVLCKPALPGVYRQSKHGGHKKMMQSIHEAEVHF